MPKIEDLVKKWEKEFLDEKSNEVAEARAAIIKTLKELRTTLPAAVFALDLVKMELMRGQLEEFLGNVQLTKELPLSKKA